MDKVLTKKEMDNGGIGRELLEIKEVLEALGCSKDEVKKALLVRVGVEFRPDVEACVDDAVQALHPRNLATLTEKGLLVHNPNPEDVGIIKSLFHGESVFAKIGDLLVEIKLPPMKIVLAGDIPDEIRNNPSLLQRGVVFDPAALS